jgi:hypothetical protein
MMTPRERFNAVMDFKEPDKLPWVEWIWTDAILSWVNRYIDAAEVTKAYPGRPVYKFLVNTPRPVFIEDIDLYSHFGCMKVTGLTDPIDKGPIPRTLIKQLAKTKKYIEWRADTDVVVRLSRNSPHTWYSMPQFMDWPVKDKKTWDEYKKRFDPKDIRRYPKDWNKDAYREKFRDYSAGPTRIMFNGFFGFGAQLMGLTKFTLLFYENPDLAHEMANFWESYTIEHLRPFLDACGEYVDSTWWWEDFAENHGPFISPKLFEKFFLPHYKRVANFIHQKGVKHIMVDSDGQINPILNLLIEVGVDSIWPLEVSANMDAAKIMEKYGNKIRLLGNLDKRKLRQGGEIMKKEVDRGIAVAKEYGGYIPGTDHVVADYTYQAFKEYADYMQKKL